MDLVLELDSPVVLTLPRPIDEDRADLHRQLAEIIGAVAAGDRNAFADLYAGHVGMVHAILLGRVPRKDVDDLVQEVFIAAYTRIGELRDAAAFGGWLATIARNRATDHLRQSREQVDEMTELVDDILFLSELEQGREVVALGETEAAPVLRDVVAERVERAETAGLRLELRIENETILVPLRRRMLRTVAENLVDNAIRYAGEGATCVVSLQREEGRIVLEAADDGAGVPEEDAPRLFERFFRSDRARTTRGSGLGLAIVKHVVETAGGHVEARGAKGRGLDVRCVLPSG